MKQHRLMLLPFLCLKIFLIQTSNYPAGIACGKHTGGNIPGDHAAGADDGIVADGDAGKNQHAGAEPDIAAHGDGLENLIPFLPALRIHGVMRGAEGAVGADADIVTKDHLTAIKDLAVIVGEKSLADGNAAAIVAVEGGEDLKLLSGGAEKAGEDLSSCFGISGRTLVEPVAKISGTLPLMLVADVRNNQRFHEFFNKCGFTGAHRTDDAEVECIRRALCNVPVN